MARLNSLTVLKSALFAGFVAVVFTAPAKSDFVELTMPSWAPGQTAEASPRLNLVNSVSAEERWGRHQIEWQDPRSIQDPMDRQRKIEPLFVVKF